MLCRKGIFCRSMAAARQFIGARCQCERKGRRAWSLWSIAGGHRISELRLALTKRLLARRPEPLFFLAAITASLMRAFARREIKRPREDWSWATLRLRGGRFSIASSKSAG